MDFRVADWTWDPSQGSQGTAFCGTDFNVDKDVDWFREALPSDLLPLFEAVEVALLPAGQAPAGAELVDGTTPTVFLDVRWLRFLASKGWEGLDEVMVHEKHHLIQLLEGRLEIDHPKGVYKWEDKEYTAQQVIDSYPHLPWEEEAYWEQAQYVALKGDYPSPHGGYDALMRLAHQALAA